jgi:hypothetical protein
VAEAFTTLAGVPIQNNGVCWIRCDGVSKPIRSEAQEDY